MYAFDLRLGCVSVRAYYGKGIRCFRRGIGNVCSREGGRISGHTRATEIAGDDGDEGG